MTRADKFEEIFGYRPATDQVLCNEHDCGESDACDYCMCNPDNIGLDEDWWNAEYKEPTTKNNLGVNTDKLISDCEKMSFDIEIFNKPLKVVALDAVKNIVNDLPSVTPQEPRKCYLSIDDVMSVFDDFMCGEVDEEGTETFLEMLKDKAESEDKE